MRVARKNDFKGHLTIRNFKSIEELHMDLARVNVLIGEPATGKSNILESVALFSFLYVNSLGIRLPLNYFVRLRDPADMFFIRDATRKIEVSISVLGRSMSLSIYRRGSDYYIESSGLSKLLRRDYRGQYIIEGKVSDMPLKVLYYSFVIRQIKKQFEKAEILLPPSGMNLLHIIKENGTLREIIGEFLRKRGLELLLKMGEGELVIQGRIDNIAFELPLWLISDTFIRLFVVLAIPHLYERSIVVLEEPESKSYPYYTKVVAEQIALDNRNLYIISTHNPYMLYALLEKTRIDQIKIFVTKMLKNRTTVQELNKEKIDLILSGEIDPFISIEELVDDQQKDYS